MKHTMEARQRISLSLLGNKRGLGYRHTDEAKKNISLHHADRQGNKHPLFGKKNENSPLWRGDNIKYSGLHMWLRRTYGGANNCEKADNTCKGRFEWSNISQEYKRDLSDWQQLCSSHHKRYDLGNKI